MSFLSSGRSREIFTQLGDSNIGWVGAVGRSVDVILIEEKERTVWWVSRRVVSNIANRTDQLEYL